MWNEDGNIYISPTGVVDGASKGERERSVSEGFYGHQEVVQ